MTTIAITSGYFNPIHPGHIECFKLSLEHADRLWVIVNNDYQAFAKRGSQSFQTEQDRLAIVSAIKYVDYAEIAMDRDLTVCQTLADLIEEAQAMTHRVIFAKGGDRLLYEIPERKVCEKYGVKVIDGLGAKTHSSSDYIKRVRE